jgi:hypothetical protein
MSGGRYVTAGLATERELGVGAALAGIANEHPMNNIAIPTEVGITTFKRNTGIVYLQRSGRVVS